MACNPTNINLSPPMFPSPMLPLSSFFSDPFLTLYFFHDSFLLRSSPSKYPCFSSYLKTSLHLSLLPSYPLWQARGRSNIISGYDWSSGISRRKVKDSSAREQLLDTCQRYQAAHIERLRKFLLK